MTGALPVSISSMSLRGASASAICWRFAAPSSLTALSLSSKLMPSSFPRHRGCLFALVDARAGRRGRLPHGLDLRVLLGVLLDELLRSSSRSCPCSSSCGPARSGASPARGANDRRDPIGGAGRRRYPRGRGSVRARPGRPAPAPRMGATANIFTWTCPAHGPVHGRGAKWPVARQSPP